MTAVAPASITDKRPSANGKKASDAAAEPRQRLGARAAEVEIPNHSFPAFDALGDGAFHVQVIKFDSGVERPTGVGSLIFNII